MSAYTAPRASTVVVVPETGSTQQDLIALAADVDGWPHLSGIRAERQTAGHGRGDRRWDTEQLTALTASLVLRPDMPHERWPWIPLLVGRVLVDSLNAFQVGAALKWPNDVVLHATTPIDGWGHWRKVAGVLAQVLPDRSGVVVGIGVNLDGTPPVPWATTLHERGADVDPGALLELVRARLAQALATDPGTWRGAVEHVCVSVGIVVDVHRPDGTRLRGRALGLDTTGGLVLRDSHGGQHLVMAGDVEHLRTSPGSAG
jgi:BirA family biotin operon repressor/biotin-[acetyl-CoA-carboxylase] ligase